MSFENTGGRALMRTIRNYGVDTVFGIPGTHNLEFYRVLGDLGIAAVTTRHEQGAGYAADGWSQRRGLPGVVITTSGPGLLNALSAAGTAFCESRPLLILSPGTPRGTGFEDRGLLHESKDPTGAAGSVMLWSRRVESDAEAVEAIHDAFRLFESGRPRPVHIEVPLDVLEAASTAEESALERRRFDLAVPEQSGLDAAARMLDGAANPVIIGGGGALPAADELRLLAETLGAPVVTSLNGKAAIPESHPLSLRAELRLAATLPIIEAADVVLIIGSKVGEAELWGRTLEPRGSIIRIDIDENRIDANLAADVAVVGDSRVALPALRKLLTGEPRQPEGLDAIRQAQREEADAFSPGVMRLAREITALLPEHATVSGDSSQITYYGMTSAVVQEEPKKFLYMPAYATLGYGLPAAIGAAVAEPDSSVVCVLGDGALMFSVQELVTAAEQKLNLTVVCVDNGGYQEIRENEVDRGIEPVGVELVQPDWPLLAVAFGGSGHTATDYTSLRSTLAAAIAEPGVSLVHVPFAQFTDPDAGAESEEAGDVHAAQH